MSFDRECLQPMSISRRRLTLWDLLRLRGIPARIIGLLTGLYSGTVSAVKCGGGVSSCEYRCEAGLCACSITFQHMHGLGTRQGLEQSHFGASVGNTKITDLVFADDAPIFAESLEILVMALEALHEEVKPLGLKISWPRPRFKCLEACWMKQYSLSMRVARTLRS